MLAARLQDQALCRSPHLHKIQYKEYFAALPVRRAGVVFFLLLCDWTFNYFNHPGSLRILMIHAFYSSLCAVHHTLCNLLFMAWREISSYFGNPDVKEGVLIYRAIHAEAWGRESDIAVLIKPAVNLRFIRFFGGYAVGFVGLHYFLFSDSIIDLIFDKTLTAFFILARNSSLAVFPPTEVLI